MKLSEEVAKLSYKPGWGFSLGYDLIGGYAVLHIRATVQNARTLEPYEFQLRRLVPDCAMAGRGVFLHWVETLLAEAELHEMREFFRFNGKLVDDPHADLTVITEDSKG